MNLQDLSIIALQIALPLAMLLWLNMAPTTSVFDFGAHLLAVASLLLALILIPVWLSLPWWTPYVYVAIGLIIVLRPSYMSRTVPEYRLPRSTPEWIRTVVFTALAIGCTWLGSQALYGRSVPDDQVIDLEFPMGTGVYLVANGGSTQIINAHLMTLTPATERQRNYRGQSFAVDLVKVSHFGRRASGWRPADPALYSIFAEPVYAPCAGTVLSALDGMPDMPIPKPDTSRLEGNHVFIDCGEFGVLLAHFRQGSVQVSTGDRVSLGTELAQVGNSGQSGEPHLHIHAQRNARSNHLLGGEPLFVTFGGRFPVRNDRIVIEDDQ